MVRVAVVFAIVFGVGCKSEAQKQAETAAIQEKARVEQRALDQQEAETKAKQEREAAKANEAALKNKILANPSDYLAVNVAESFNEGILSSYRQLVKLSVTNKTKYPLQGLSGQIEWLDDQGEMREVTVFRLVGSIAGGDTKTFSTAAGDMESSKTESHAHKWRVKFMKAKFVDMPE